MNKPTIQIPEIFLKILSEDHKRKVFSIFEKYLKIVEDNKLTFFPEFTDHGIQHIQNVILSAENLITEDSFKNLTSDDILALLLSIYLHDIAMHISAAGFERLIKNQVTDQIIEGFDQKNWNELWNDFIVEVRKFNDEQIKDIWGQKDIEIKTPNFNNLDEYSIKLIGEFLRRYHARLAHEIALWGFPGLNENINICEEISSTLKDIIGLISRSHGHELRDTFNYLEKKYSVTWSTPHNVKVFFIMVVLRVADYIQINSERAPQILLKVKRFSSPLSLREWEKHNAIEHINYNTNDPELIYVLARPTNSKIFLELTNLFKSIQTELDRCWAVLGEVYGRIEEINKLKIKYRRIKSNLDNKEQFSLQVNYIPEHVIFDADPELLKLLVGPLYDNDPQYGIRELLQNSVDATLEKKFLLDRENPESKFVPSIDVILEFENEQLAQKEILEEQDFRKLRLIFIDNGIGMNEYVLINYFLRAGASFRKSNVWRKNFFEFGHSEIQRTGRFGIGVLAGFLLGDSIEIYTRHYSSIKHGLYLNASLNENEINIYKINTDYGTKLIINLNETVCQILYEAYSKLKKGESYSWEHNKQNWFDWYKISKPKINYTIPSNIRDLFNFTENANFVPAIDESSTAWREFTTGTYKKIKWTFDKNSEIRNSIMYERNKPLKNPMLLCNGFSIPYGYKNDISSYKWELPRVSVFDFDSQLPLSLNRNYIFNDKLPFMDELYAEIAKDIIAKILLLNFTKVGKFYCLAEPTEINYLSKVNLIPSIFIRGNNYSLSYPSIMKHLGIKKLVNIWFNKIPSDELIFADNTPYIARKTRVNNIKLFNELFYFYSHKAFTRFSIYNNKSAAIIHKRYFLKADKHKYLMENNRLSNDLQRNLKVENQNALGWSILNQSDRFEGGFTELNKSIVELESLKNDFEKIDFIIENDIYLNTQEEHNQVFTNILSEYMDNDFLIPIDKQERKNKYNRLFKSLDRYFDKATY